MDIRAGEWPAGYPTAVGSIKPGDGATFSVSVYGYDQHGKYGLLQMGQVAAIFHQSEVHFRLYYGWGQAGVVQENGCTNIAKGNTQFCYHQASQGYLGPSGHSQGSPETVWTTTTDVPAPTTDLTTLFDAIWLIPGPPGDKAAPLAVSAAGNYQYGLAAKQVFITTANIGSAPLPLLGGTPVTIEACITNGDCSKGLVSSGNYLGDWLYVCDQWPPTGSNGAGLPPNGQLYTSGKADQVLGGIKQEFSPPADQNWTNDYSAFASSHSNLTQNNPCPSSAKAVNAGTATGIQTDFSSMQITWEGPQPMPPQVSLTATPTNPAAGQSVKLLATAVHPDGNARLYICARSGTSWLTLSPPGSDGYLGEAPASSSVPEAEGTAVQSSRTGGTAQFLAFLSTDTSPPSSCPSPGASGSEYGTSSPPGWTASAGPWHSSYDYSQVINVTWPNKGGSSVPTSTTTPQSTTTSTPTSVPTSTTTTTPGSKMSVTLTANPPTPTAGHKTTLTASYTNAPPGFYVYICKLNGSSLSLSDQSPYAAGARAVAGGGQLTGWALSNAAATATFVAYLSSSVGQTSSGSCPSAPGQQGATALTSLEVTWLPTSSPTQPNQTTVPPFYPQFVPPPKPPCYWVTEQIKKKKIMYEVCPPAPPITVTLQAVPSSPPLPTGDYKPKQTVTLVAHVYNQPAGDYVEIRALGPDQPKIAGPGEWLGSPVQGASTSGQASGNLVHSAFVAYDTPYPGSNIVRAMSNVVVVNWAGWMPS